MYWSGATQKHRSTTPSDHIQFKLKLLKWNTIMVKKIHSDKYCCHILFKQPSITCNNDCTNFRISCWLPAHSNRDDNSSNMAQRSKLTSLSISCTIFM